MNLVTKSPHDDREEVRSKSKLTGIRSLEASTVYPRGGSLPLEL